MSEPTGPGEPEPKREPASQEPASQEPESQEPAAQEPAAVGWLPREAEELFGPGAVASEAYDALTVDVPAAAWTAALRTARDELGCTFFDWLSAVDEPDAGFRVAAHVVAVGTPPRRLLLRTTVPHGAPALATATGVYAGAAWHERETHEMFGVDFAGHPHLAPLLLPEEFEGHPLRKDFVLAARVAKAWPGAKEPGEPHDGGPKRRQMQPPGVPDPNDWGPQKGQLPPAPARPARRGGPRAEGTPRRARSASAGSASQRTAGGGSAAGETPRPRPRTPDAPWQSPRPGDEPPPPPATAKDEDTPPAEGAEAPPEPSAPDGSAPPPEPAAGEPAPSDTRESDEGGGS